MDYSEMGRPFKVGFFEGWSCCAEVFYDLLVRHRLSARMRRLVWDAWQECFRRWDNELREWVGDDSRPSWPPPGTELD